MNCSAGRTKKLKNHPLSKCIDRESLPEFAAHTKKVFKKGERDECELKIIKADGTTAYVYLISEPVKDDKGKVIECRTSLVDISQRKSSEESLRASEHRYRGLFESMTEGFALHEIICDKKGKPCDYRFLEMNSAFEELTGLKRKNVVGKTVSEVLPDNDPQWVEIYGKVALTGEPMQFDSHSTPLNKDYEVFAYSPAPKQFAVLFTDSNRTQAT